MATSARIEEIKKKFDENPRRYFAPLANEFRKAGDLEQAIVICEEFLPQQPGHMSGHIVYGQALYEAGRLPESRTVFETALGLDPENLIALRHLGDIAHSEGDLAGARQWYDRVLEADPRNDEIQGLIASLNGMEGLAISVVGAASPEFASIELELDHGSLLSPTVVELGKSALGSVVVPPELPAPDSPFEAQALSGLETTDAVAVPDAVTKTSAPEHARAVGLQSAEFEPPTVYLERAEGLEPLEFEPPVVSPAPAGGLDLTDFHATGAGLPVLDVRPVANSLAPFVSALPSLARDEERAASRDGMGAARHAPARAEATGGEHSALLELTPAVIAAESALSDEEGRDDERRALYDSRDAVSGPQPPFVTETMAQLYLKQGFRAQSLDVYRQLSAAKPADARLRERVTELEREIADVSSTVAGGPTVREFFARLANRRPGDRSEPVTPVSHDDFALFEAVPEEPSSSPLSGAGGPGTLDRYTPGGGLSTMPSASERATTAQGGPPSPGTIDALFGTRATSTSEDSAASALAQAFGGATDVPSITGRPARAATAELSLDSVFRDAPPRPPRISKSFSFDQFFSENAVTDAGISASVPAPESPPQSEPAERSAEDVSRFNSWLQGLKQR